MWAHSNVAHKICANIALLWGRLLSCSVESREHLTGSGPNMGAVTLGSFVLHVHYISKCEVPSDVVLKIVAFLSFWGVRITSGIPCSLEFRERLSGTCPSVGTMSLDWNTYTYMYIAHVGRGSFLGHPASQIFKGRLSGLKVCPGMGARRIDSFIELE